MIQSLESKYSAILLTISHAIWYTSVIPSIDLVRLLTISKMSVFSLSDVISSTNTTWYLILPSLSLTELIFVLAQITDPSFLLYLLLKEKLSISPIFIWSKPIFTSLKSCGSKIFLILRLLNSCSE